MKLVNHQRVIVLISISAPLFCPLILLFLCISDQKPLSVEVGEASTLRLLGAEQENAELKRRLEELQAQQEVGGSGV